MSIEGPRVRAALFVLEWALAQPSCLPLGEGAERSEAEGGNKSIAIDISQPFRLLAKLAATFPFREDIMIYWNSNFLYAPCKGAGIATGDDWGLCHIGKGAERSEAEGRISYTI